MPGGELPINVRAARVRDSVLGGGQEFLRQSCRDARLPGAGTVHGGPECLTGWEQGGFGASETGYH